LAKAEQAAVEDAVNLEFACLSPGFNAKAPRLDALIPVRTYKAEIAIQPGAGK
jgi:hypothetical protein